MSASRKPLLRALAGETLDTPPVWLMRQAGRYLPEYRATREKAGGFLELCGTPELAIEVTMQPIRRFGFDAAIVFADILLVPQALGLDLWFESGEGPRLSTTTTRREAEALTPADAIHARLAPVYETLRGVSRELPEDVALIGFAGAPWTVATYMIAGRGTPSQEPARRLILEDRETFALIIDRVTEATIAYLSRQIEAGAEVVKLFDSWAGSLNWEDFEDWCVRPIERIVTALKARHPGVPVVGFPRGAGARYEGFSAATGVDCVALDSGVPPAWARERLQGACAVQGNLDPIHMVHGGSRLVEATRRLLETLGKGPWVFNLGHGITPDADPRNVELLLKTIRDGG